MQDVAELPFDKGGRVTSENANQLDLFQRNDASEGKVKLQDAAAKATAVAAAPGGNPCSVSVPPQGASDWVSPETTSVPDNSRGHRFLSDKQVAERYSISRPSVWRWVKSVDGFPAPIQLGVGTTRWALEDLEAYERSLSKKSAVARAGIAS